MKPSSHCQTLPAVMGIGDTDIFRWVRLSPRILSAIYASDIFGGADLALGAKAALANGGVFMCLYSHVYACM